MKMFERWGPLGGAAPQILRRAAGKPFPSAVSLRPVMRFAEHLAVTFVGDAAIAPRLHMVGIHFAKFPQALPVCIVTYGAERTVADTFTLALAVWRSYCIISGEGSIIPIYTAQ